MSSLTTDKSAAKRIANEYAKKTALREFGIIDQEKEKQALAQNKTIDECLSLFVQELNARKASEKHTRMTKMHVLEVCRRCELKTIGQIIRNKVHVGLDQIAEEKSLSNRTRNAYLTSMKSFARWLCDEEFLASNKLSGIKALNLETDRRYVRRELTQEEIISLIEYVQNDENPRRKLKGVDRAIVYQIALGTGFRIGEMRSLTHRSLNLDDEKPTITVEATHSKRRQKDTQPIRVEFAEVLSRWLLSVDDSIFQEIPTKTAKMLHRDMDEARKSWIERSPNCDERARRKASDFLRYQNSKGEVVDFHSTRHTYISSLVASPQTSPKTCQKLARHSTVRLTIDRYAHSRPDEEIQAIENGLPRTSNQWVHRDLHRMTHSNSTTNATPCKKSTPKEPEKSKRGASKKARNSGETQLETTSCNEKQEEAPPGFEPGMADLQSAALAAWLRRLRVSREYTLKIHVARANHDTLTTGKMRNLHRLLSQFSTRPHNRWKYCTGLMSNNLSLSALPEKAVNRFFANIKKKRPSTAVP